jgi:superfamily I DNA/RNA helicase
LLQYEILKTAEHPEYREWYFANGQEAGKLISRMKSAMITNFSNPNLEEIIEDIDLDLPTDPWSLSVYRQLAERSYEFTGEKGACVIDFDDMLYQPLAHKCDFPQYDFVFVDEAQDLNHVQRLFISCLLKHDGRMVAVGDTHQAIYGFRGASHNSMDLIKEHYGCRELPLSICYRCDTSIVEVAQQFVPHIEARRGAGPGVVEIVENAGHFRLYKSGDYILCRTNAPLVHEAMRLSIMGNNVCILGNDVVPRLAKMAKEIEKDEGCICNRTIKQYGMNNAWRIPQEKKFKRAVFDDNLEVLGYIAGDTEMSADSIKKVLDNIFFDKPPVEACIMLSTVHKAKGLEAERVFIIRPDLMPFPYAETAEELQQERNLIYVAVTRAKKELYYVRPDND